MLRVLFAISFLAILPAALAADEPLDISAIMVRAHLRPENRGTRNNLDSKVIDGKATAAEKQELLDLYTQLAKLKPPSDDLADWNKRTDEMVEAVKAVIRGDCGAPERLLKARDCKACHALHRS